MQILKYTLTSLVIGFALSGCSTTSLIKTNKSLPKVYFDINSTHELKKDVKISLFTLDNYTDTPQAGKRAANIIEGVLLSKGYKVTSHLSKDRYSLKKAKKTAKKDDSKYFLMGALSEWRYKTGIDGEPAVSLKAVLYKTKNAKVVWSATGSDSHWGNASIGTTAQDLIESMLEN